MGFGVVAWKTPGTLVLASSALVCAVLGSIHAFSVFLEPLENAFDLNRSTVSLTYSFALVALTLAVLIGPKFYAAVCPGHFLVAVGVIGAFGAVLAGLSNGIVGVWIGYSACFGIANGMGYGFALQYAARANPSRPGVAMGIVTAAYAFGAALWPAIFVTALDIGDFFAAMALLAIALLLASVVAGRIVTRSGLVYKKSSQGDKTALPSAFVVTRFWLAYGAGVATGLMAIGHAAGFADLAGITPWLAPAVLAICNLFGSLVGGHLVDRFSHRMILSTLPMISIVALMNLAFYSSQTLLALGALGFAYGGTIAVYPAVIAKQFPGDAGPRVYGQVFTAWGMAGLIAPWVAGLLFDQSQNYSSALWIATALAVFSAGIAGRAIR